MKPWDNEDRRKEKKRTRFYYDSEVECIVKKKIRQVDESGLQPVRSNLPKGYRCSIRSSTRKNFTFTSFCKYTVLPAKMAFLTVFISR